MPKNTRQRHKARGKPPSGRGLVHSALQQVRADAGRTRGTGRTKPRSLAPWGWFDAAPTQVQSDTFSPECCIEFRQGLLEWVAEGLGRAQVKDDVSTEPRTVTAYWDGDVVALHGGSVVTADAVVLLSMEVADKQGYLINQVQRNDVGLDEDLDRRVLGCFCNHKDCRNAGRTIILEMRWPVANAALERRRPDIGFVAPPPPSRFKDLYGNGGPNGAMRVLMSLGMEQDHGREPIDARQLSDGGRGYAATTEALHD